MRKKFVLLFALVAMVVAGMAMAQQTNSLALPGASELSRMQTSQNALFDNIVVYRRTHNALAGFLAGTKGDTLIVQTGGREEFVPLSDISKVVIDVESMAGKYAIAGMLSGIYLGNLLFFSAKNQPTAYFGSDDNEWFELLAVNSGSALVGGGLGYVIGLGSGDEKVFDFTGSERQQQAEWQRLQRHSLREPPAKKVHLTFQAGHVYTRVSSRYKDALEEAGFRVNEYSFDGPEKASNFNLLRKAQLMVSIADKAEIGAALMWLGEPRVWGDFGANFFGNVSQSLDATGYYALVIYPPLRARKPRQNLWNVGLGIGAAKVDFSLRAVGRTRSLPFRDVMAVHNVTKTSFSIAIFTGLNLYLY